MIDDDSTAPGIHHKDERKSQSEENPAYDSDVAIQVPNVNITEKTNNKDELSSDVDIAPSGIVAKTISDSESDEGNIPLGEKCDGYIRKTGK